MTPPEAPFDEPWQAQAFALAVYLHGAGAFTWSEWAAALAAEIAARPHAPYYEAWLAALEHLTGEKRLATRAELSHRKDEWEHAYLHTPHGQPVELAGVATGS
ncbi:MAG TPA: nitrile hydratase accessory protein [Caulobacteraceae bacterium]|nr:nitrile hydratase accessory protein [Caulobacteraceae bacterium]